MSTPIRIIRHCRSAASLLIASAIGLVTSAVAQQNILFNFNNTDVGAVNSAFTTTSGSLNYFGAAGVGNSGYVDNFGANVTTIYNTPLTTIGIQSITITSFVKTGAITDPGGVGTVFAAVGISNFAGTGAVFSADSTTAEMFGLQIATASTDTNGLARWQARTDTVAGTPVTAVIGSTFTLESNTWYRISATYTKSAINGTWEFTSSITPFGSDGLTEGPLLSSASGSFIQSSTYAADTLYGAVQFRGGGFGLRMTALDNFAATTTVAPPVTNTDISFDFNNTDIGGVNSAFTTTNGTLNHFGVAGVGNSGYVDNFGGNVTTIHKTPLGIAGVQSLTISSFVKTGVITDAGGVGTVFATVGFSDLAGTGAVFSADSTTAEMFGIQIATASTDTNGLARWQARTDTITGTPVTAVIGSTFTLESNTWYRIRAVYTKSGTAGSWEFSGSITPFGSDGLTEGTVLSSTSGSFIQSSTYTAGALYGAVQFRGGGFGLRMTALDNFAASTAVPASLTSLQLWFSEYGLPVDGTGTGSLTADPDGDGSPNLLEYALATDPTAASDADLPFLALNADLPPRLTLSFLRARSDVTYLVESSGDLSTWQNIPFTPVAIGETQTVTDTEPVSIPSQPRRFLRLRVTYP